MASRKVKQLDNEGDFYIALTSNDGTIGQLTGEQGKVTYYKTEADAQKAIRSLQRSTHYSWNGVILSVESKGESDS